MARRHTAPPRPRHLRRQALAAASTAIAGIFAFSPVANAASTNAHAAHAVFVQTNSPAGNAVTSYLRSDAGSLTRFGSYGTGGLGGAEPGAVVDPLASQGSLTYDPAHKLLFAVNAGSDTFSVFRVHGATLRLEQVLPSGGHLPTSVSVGRHFAYVLNAGGDGSISGFVIGSNGRLHAVGGSTRSLGLGNPALPNFLSSPSQVSVTPNDDAVVVATKTHGVLDVFTHDKHGVPAASATVTESAGAVPFALSFDARGRLLVAEASGGESSYALGRNGSLSVISAHVTNGQAATCWSVVAKGYVYVANAGSNSITGYAENGRGELTLLDSSGVTATTDRGPVDLAASGDGRYIYQQATGAGVIDEYAVNAGGSLTRIGTVTGLTPDNGTGYEGIAAS